jgi:hypothetical protein
MYGYGNSMFLATHGILAKGASAGSLLLDTYTNANVAYSLRKLRTAYAGNCIRVRRSSDNTSQDIGFVNNVLDTASLLTFVGVGSGFISEWYDQSGNGLNVSQGTALSQPRIVNAGVLDTKGSKAAIFSVSSDLLTRTSLAFGNYPFNLSIFSVSYNNVSLANASVCSTNTPLAGAGIQHYCDRRAVKRNTILYGATVTNTFDLSVQRDDSNQRLLSLFTNASTNAASAFDNGNAGTSGTVTGGTHTETAFNVLGTTSSGIQELIIYKADNSANRTAIESNINTYYSIY